MTISEHDSVTQNDSEIASSGGGEDDKDKRIEDEDKRMEGDEENTEVEAAEPTEEPTPPHLSFVLREHVEQVAGIDLDREAEQLQTSAGIGGNNYLRFVEWSPTGDLLFTVAADEIVRLRTLKETIPISPSTVASFPARGNATEMPVYDVQWLTSGSHFALLRKNCPVVLTPVPEENRESATVHLVPVDPRSCEPGDARSIQRPRRGTKTDGPLLVGGTNVIWQFDLETRTAVQVIPLLRRSPGGVLRGIVSSLAWQEDSSLFAAGSYSGQLVCFDTRDTSRKPTLCLKLEDSHTEMQGICQLQWSRTAPTALIAGHRNDTFIRIWDVRLPARPVKNLPSTAPVAYCPRSASHTHQHLRFDVYESTNQSPVIITPQTDGSIAFFDMVTSSPRGCLRVHDTVCSGVSVRRGQDTEEVLLATGSGTRLALWENSSDSEDDTRDMNQTNTNRKINQTNGLVNRGANKLVFWKWNVRDL